MEFPITKEVLQGLLQGGENVAKVAVGTAKDLTNEAINLFIIDSLLSILKFSVVFIIFYIVKRYCEAMSTDATPQSKNVIKAFKTTALVLSLIFFTTQSFPHLQVITKALVAPKIFLIEKTADFVKK